MMTLDGFRIQKSGKTAGLIWINFDEKIQIHGRKGLPGSEDRKAYLHALQQKARMIDRFILTELRLGTKHYDSNGNLLLTHHAVVMNHQIEGGFFIELPPDRKWKFDAYVKEFGIGHSDDRKENQG